MNLLIYRSSLWVLSFLIQGAQVDKQADRLLGYWLFPSKGSSVRIYRRGNQYFARVAKVDQAGKKNFGLVKGAILIRNLKYDGKAWSDGQLIHPKTGSKLKVDVSMNTPRQITVTVYKGIKLFHRKFTMTRSKRTSRTNRRLL